MENLIVLIICAQGATSMSNSQTLLLRFKNNTRSFARYMKIQRHEFSAN